MMLGYACINITLGSKITTNRSMIRKTFDEKGLSYVSELAVKNTEDLLHILKWNSERGIKLFRLSSDILPWGSEYNFNDLPNSNIIRENLKRAGDYATENGIRITTHPGPFVVLTSPKESVVNNSIKDLEIHGMIFDMMGLSQTPYNKINIHCNGVYGDKQSAIDRFCENYKRLSKSVQSRLTVENDDRKNMYSVNDLMYIHNKISIPIVFDAHHFLFNTGNQTNEEALKLAVSTWPKNIRPIIHYSESKSLHENNVKIKPQAHSDYINNLPNTYGLDVDIMLECKMKELALIDIRDKMGII